MLATTIDPCSLVAQIKAASGGLRLQSVGMTRRHSPAGVMSESGASMAVLRYLRADGQYRRASEILRATGRSHSAVSWALLFLRRLDLVESVPDSRRNQRYLRYRAKL